jgi:membrane-associated phospholipid phosphatase
VLNTAFAITVALALQAAPQAGPRTSDPWPDDRPLTHLFQNLATDLHDLPSVTNAEILGVGGAGALIAHPADDNLADWAARQQSSSYTTFGRVIGDGWVQGGAAIGAYAVGRLTQDARLTHIGSDLIRGQVLNGALTTGIKVVVNRERPNGGNHAFPSGHASAAFTSAAVLQSHFGWRTGIPAYALAGFVGWTRVRDDVHWLSDVAFGATIGTIAGQTVTRGHRAGTWTVVPVRTPGGIAIYVTRR